MLKFIHVLGAVAWVGGIILTQAHAAWVNRRANPADFMHFVEFQAWLGTRYFAPLAFIVLLAGVGMVIESGWNFTDTWILIGLALWTITVITGAMYLGPQTEKIRAGLMSGGPPDTALQRRINNVRVASQIDLVVVILVIGDMVIKPGA